MASVYKSMSKSKVNGSEKNVAQNGQDVRSKNRQRVLMLTSRGVTYRHRHLLTDLHQLLPHSRKDAKLDTKTQLSQLNELADLYNTNNILFLEARKGKDLYLWLSKPPNGPTIKFHAQNIHTMEELNFPGNCLKGSRPVLSFDGSFEQSASLRLCREVLSQTFGVPPGERKRKPFVDHVMSFTVIEDKIWIRCYQISETEAVAAKPVGEAAAEGAKSKKTGETSITLSEIGPRFVLTPIVMLEGSFGGPVIYENKEFVSPNQVRSELRRAKAGKYNRRAEGMVERKARHRDLGLNTGEGTRQRDALDERELFA